jgi:dephospho-CoA kinase
MSPFAGKTVVGLTGGIACGKTSALNRFNSLGWSVVSADSLVAEILATNSEVKTNIRQRWGEGGFDSFGNIDKPAIGRIVFKEDSERKWIENLLHPIIRSLWISFVQSCSSKKCLVELPLLFENNLHTQFTCVVTMYASNSTINKRLLKRGLSHEEANARLSSQLPIVQKVKRADFVLWGGGTNEFLNRQVDDLAPTLL